MKAEQDRLVVEIYSSGRGHVVFSHMQTRERRTMGVLLLSSALLLTTCQLQFNKSAGNSLALQVTGKSLAGGASIEVTISQGSTTIAQQTLPIGGNTSIDFSFSMPPSGTYTVLAVRQNGSGGMIDQMSTQLNVPMGNYPVVLTFPVLVAGITITPGTPSGGTITGDVWFPSNQNQTLQLNTTISPANASNQTVTWSILSSDIGYFTVSSTGLITISDSRGAGGNIPVTATANDGTGITATFYVNCAFDG